MRSRALLCLLLGAGLGLQITPVAACEQILGVAVDCDPTPTPTPEPKPRKAIRTVSDPVGSLFEAIVRERKQKGLPTLRFDSTVSTLAKEHAGRMARRGKIYHNKTLGSAAMLRRLGRPSFVMENVGFGPTTTKVHRAFMNSPSHRRAILHPSARVVGLGVVTRDGKLWISQVFQDRHAPGGRVSSPPRPTRSEARGVARTGSTKDVVVALPPMADGGASEQTAVPGVAAVAGMSGVLGVLGLLRRRRRRV